MGTQVLIDGMIKNEKVREDKMLQWTELQHSSHSGMLKTKLWTENATNQNTPSMEDKSNGYF